jgi:eukaryotic-like serine/threonine-protein kinase
MVSIELRRTWNVGSEIANGGFGKIYEAHDGHGSQAVIKFVPKAPGASRELLFEPVSGHPNIIPIWDSGEWENYYVLVMPRAEKSLRQHLGEAEGTLTTDESLGILIDVAEALAGLEPDVVHRDLKPENILLYGGCWCLADFGIARYAEATTAPDTHKYAFTAPYAAPEQWRVERATPATDVYAFGVTAFELLQGHRPFSGPDYREQHLNQAPPSLVGCSPSIASLVTECLYKAPQARPTPANILARLRRSQQPSSPAAVQLQAVNQLIVAQQAQAGVIASAQKSTEEQRRELFHTARQSLETILERLNQRICSEAPAAIVARLTYLVVELGNGRLSIESIQPTPPQCLAAFGAPPVFESPAFDVIAHTAIGVRKPCDQFNYEGRSHSLWFCDAYDEGVYRWFETAFMIKGFVPFISTVNPFALSPTDKEKASRCQIAWEPLPFDQGDEEQFIERWLGWFAGAVGGALHMPSQMPENSGGHHRRPSSTLAVS